MIDLHDTVKQLETVRLLVAGRTNTQRDQRAIQSCLVEPELSYPLVIIRILFYYFWSMWSPRRRISIGFFLTCCLLVQSVTNSFLYYKYKVRITGIS